VVGSTVLRRPAIQSPNYVAGTSGWTVNADGSAEFNNLTIRGTFAGTDFIISSAGLFLYSPSEGAGNLIASIAPAAGTDQFGNAYQGGITSYSSSTDYFQITADFINIFKSGLFQGQQLLSTGAAITQLASGLQNNTDTESTLILESADAAGGSSAASLSAVTVTIINNIIVGGNATVDGNLTVDGTLTAGAISGSTAGPTGTGFFNTQGLASGSYGSTHQHTLPNFPTATHTHAL